MHQSASLPNLYICNPHVLSADQKCPLDPMSAYQMGLHKRIVQYQIYMDTSCVHEGRADTFYNVVSGNRFATICNGHSIAGSAGQNRGLDNHFH